MAEPPTHPRQRTRWRRRLAVFGPAFIVIVTGALSYSALRRALETRSSVEHTRDVMETSDALLTSLLDGETGQLGYLLTYDSTFLAPFHGTEVRAMAAVSRLRILTADNPAQQRRLDTLSSIVERRFIILDSTIANERMGKTDLARALVTYGPGEAMMLDLRSLIDGINREEARLLVGRRERERRSVELTSVVVILGSLLAALLAFLVNSKYDQALIDRRVALEEVQSANEKLQEQAVELEHQADASQNVAMEAEQASEQAQDALHQAEESERRAERLQAATEAFTAALSLGEVCNLVVDQTMQAIGAQSGALAAFDEEPGRLRFLAVRSIPAIRTGDTVGIDEGRPMCIAVREERAIVSESFDETAEKYPYIAEEHRRDGIQAFAAYPMRFDGKTVGVIVMRFIRAHALPPADHALLAAMSRIATEAFERARLYDAERSARTAAESANRAKAAFLASMSHELRTPLQAALGFAQLVRSGVYGPINEPQAEVLGRVERSQMHLARLIDDILDFARLEAGRVRMKLENVPLTEVFAELTPLVEPQAAAKKIELSLLPPPDALSATADRHRLRQILVNVVGNAIKFTPERGTIRVEAFADGATARIQVHDTGIGIPADRQEAIFEPFVQVEDGLTRTASGAGLGLAISRDLARAMGGDMTVESEVGKGSTFSIVLPIAARQGEAV